MSKFSIKKKNTSDIDIQNFIKETAHQLILAHLEEMQPDIINEIKILINNNERLQLKIKGDKGNTGLQGLKGDKGEKGEEGKNGKRGERGIDGLNGRDGLSGTDGKDGSPDTPQQIISKLNTQPESLEMSIIKGLKKYLLNIQRGGKKGGGMGAPQHEVFDINLGTATITTAFTIAASGNAIMNFTYENARLEMTNHYTVGSDRKTITFSTDIRNQFANNTKAALTYIRG